MIQKQLLNVSELSQLIGIKPNTIYHWVSQKKIPYVKIGRSTKFDISEIEGWIKESSVVCKNFS